MIKKILANDGIDEQGKKLLEEAGFTVDTEKIPQDKLVETINKEKYIAVTVRSATKITKEIIDNCNSIKLIGRGGVGMDNIEVEYAKSKNIQVVNTPAASSHSVAELVFAHLFNAVRFLYDANQKMPLVGATEFDKLKKKYAKGIELSGKTIGIIGFGKIGQAVAKIALGLGMKVIASATYIRETAIDLTINGQKITVNIKTSPIEELIEKSDFISLHVPGSKLITSREIAKMKKGVIIVNCSRGGVVDENDLIEGLNNGQIAHAALDVFENEPNPNATLLAHPKISSTPHIGAATEEAQERIGIELAEKVIHFLK